MSDGIELHDVLDFVRWPARRRVRELMDQVKLVDMTSQEVLALVAALELADQRVNASVAPVPRLIPT